MTTQLIISVFTLIIYLIIIFVFNKARKKYSGGKVGKVINLILVTVCLLFIADYVTILGSLWTGRSWKPSGRFSEQRHCHFWPTAAQRWLIPEKRWGGTTEKKVE